MVGAGRRRRSAPAAAGSAARKRRRAEGLPAPLGQGYGPDGQQLAGGDSAEPWPLGEMPPSVAARLVALLGPSREAAAPLAATGCSVAARLLEGAAHFVVEVHRPLAQELRQAARWGFAQEQTYRELRQWEAFSAVVAVGTRAGTMVAAQEVSQIMLLGTHVGTAAAQTRNKFLLRLGGA